MSLIQQALEKTSRGQDTKTTNPLPATRPYERDPMGTVLEQELTRVQQSYVKRRRLYWKISMGVLLVCLMAGFFFLGVQKMKMPSYSKPASGKIAAPVAFQMPISIASGNIYRLTGITNIDGKSMAVINEEIVSVGDSLSDKAIVKEIGNGKVRLDVQGREIKLTL
jgi:hypothetical protein